MTIISEEDVEKALRAATEVQKWLDGGCSSWGVPEQAIQTIVRRVVDGLSKEAKDEKPEPKSKRGTRFDGPETIPMEWFDFANQNFTGGADLYKYEYSKFRDHWQSKPGKDGVKLEWFATWRNWCRTGLKDRRRDTVLSKSNGVLDMLAPQRNTVEIDQDSETFRAITRLRNHTAPFTGRDGKAWVSAEEIERAKNAHR